MNKKLLLFFVTISGFMFAQNTSTGVQTLKDDLSISIDTNQTTTTITVTGPSDAWFAVGFDDSASNMFSNTDVFRTDGFTITDAQTAGNQLPPADVLQDWNMVSNTEDGNIRTIVAERDNNTGDSSDYIFSNTAGSIDLIWAYGSTTNYGYHGGTNRGATTAGLTLGTKDFTNLNFGLYPNPTDSDITLQLPSSIEKARITLYDFSGRKVKDQEISLVDNSMDLKGLVNGVYVLKVASSDMVGVKRIIKK